MRSDTVGPVRLAIVEIRFYQHLVHELDENHTAELLLLGDGELVVDGVVLQGAFDE